MNALDLNISNTRDRSPGGVYIGPARRGGDESTTLTRDIFWESHVILLGEPNPELEIDADGYITKLTNVEFLGSNAGKDIGEQLVGSQVILNDIIYDEAGKVTFYANDVPGYDGRIWGNHGLIESQRTWDSVRIINESELDLVINHIDTSDGAAVVDIIVDDIRFSGADNTNNNISLNPDTPGSTFEFDLNLFYPQTEVEIRNRTAGDNEDSDIILLGGIENTIGSTTIENQRGNIRADERDLVVEQAALIPAIFDEGLIRTNTLDVDASGDIGNQNASVSSGVRSPLMVELVRITHAVNKDVLPSLKEVDLEADAGDDAVLDITLHDRSLDTAATSLAVTIDRITAGDDVDMVINDSKAGDNLSNIDGFTVRTIEPPLPTGVEPPLPTDLTGLGITYNSPNRTGEYFDHFSPDVTGISLYNWIRRTYGTVATEVDSTYTFTEVRAGDDIDIGHVDTSDSYTGAENRTYLTTQIGGTPYGAVVTEDDTPDTVIDFIINTDIDWTNGTSEDGIEQIFLTTNGEIIADELTGDMLVGHIHSTENNVTLNSGARILDADSATTVDVSGENITLNSGVVTGETPNPSIGGIGQLDDFLEINVDRGLPGRL